MEQTATADHKPKTLQGESSQTHQGENGTALLLHVADNPVLLSSRGLVLASHWNVIGTDSSNACAIFCQRDFDLVVICHSVAMPRRRRVVSHVSHISVSVPILIVCGGGLLSATPPAIITAQDPDVLIAMIGHYLQQRTPPFGHHE